MGSTRFEHIFVESATSARPRARDSLEKSSQAHALGLCAARHGFTALKSTRYSRRLGQTAAEPAAETGQKAVPSAIAAPGLNLLLNMLTLPFIGHGCSIAAPE